MFKFNKSSGQASRLLLVLAIVVLVAVIIVYLVMRMASKPPAPITPTTNVPLPVYEKTLNNIRFVFVSSLNRGNILRVSEITNKKYIDSTKEDFPISNTGAKFIQVTVAAQNMGTINTKKNVWDIGNIIDSEGRNFIPSESGIISRWLPEDNSCGDLLKPAFDPVSCTKIYEVSKESIGLKITIEYNEGSNKDSSFLDLIVK